MNRRGFLAALIGAPVAAAVGIKQAPEVGAIGGVRVIATARATWNVPYRTFETVRMQHWAEALDRSIRSKLDAG